MYRVLIGVLIGILIAVIIYAISEVLENESEVLELENEFNDYKDSSIKQKSEVDSDMILLQINNQKVNLGVTSEDFYITEYVKLSDKTVWFVTSKNDKFTQEFDDNGKPVIYDGDIDLLKQRQQDAEEFLKSLDKTVWCANPSDTEFTQNFSSRNPVIFYGDTDLLKQQYPQYNYYKLNITEAADCKGDEE